MSTSALTYKARGVSAPARSKLSQTVLNGERLPRRWSLDPLESSTAAGSSALNTLGLRRGRSSRPHPRERAILPHERVDDGGSDVQDDE